jgi:DNA polymerase theta
LILDKDHDQKVKSKEKFDLILEKDLIEYLPEPKDDPEGLFSLCLETILIGKSVVVFCPSKKWCQDCSEYLCRSLNSIPKESELGTKLLSLVDTTNIKDDNGIIKSLKASRFSLIEDLRNSAVGICPILKGTIKFGVSYHHAGLTNEEKIIIEDGYKSGIIQVLCCTSTLAAGVNLPAHRVIIRAPIMGNVDLNVATFRQMCGRAGRMGLDSQGEAIVMCSNIKYKKLALDLMTRDVDPLVSKLQEGQGGGIEKLILELVCCHKLRNYNDVEKYISCTLMYTQNDINLIKHWTKSAINFLITNQFFTNVTNNTYNASPLGIATTLSGIPPTEAILIYKPLENARKKLILNTGLHLVFLLTPPAISYIEPNWLTYYDIIKTMCKEPIIKSVCETIGIDTNDDTNDLLLYQTGKKKTPDYYSKDSKVMLYRRFYASIILFRLVQEYPIRELERSMPETSRGNLQQLQKDASNFCGMTVTFCNKLNWNILANCLQVFGGRISFGVHEELLPLVRMGPLMPAMRARSFFLSGIRNPLEITLALFSDVCQILLDCKPFEESAPFEVGKVDVDELKNKQVQMCERLSIKIINRAKEIITEEAELLNSI